MVVCGWGGGGGGAGRQWLRPQPAHQPVTRIGVFREFGRVLLAGGGGGGEDGMFRGWAIGDDISEMPFRGMGSWAWDVGVAISG